MAKFSLLLLDAVVIIELFEIGIWDEVLARCDVHIAETIVAEADYYVDANEEKWSIDMARYPDKITIHEVPASVSDDLKF